MDKVAAVEQHKRTYHTLDGLRGVAAVAVVMFHYRQFLTPFAARSAYLAVDLFFMMSGFVLAHAYDYRFRSGMRSSDFMLARICRLYPMYALGTLLSISLVGFALVRHMPSHWSWSSLVYASTFAMIFLPSFIRHSSALYPLNVPAWSLGSELLVNAAFARLGEGAGVRWLALVSVFSALPLAALALVHRTLHLGVEWNSWWGAILRVFYAFPLGVVLYRLDVRRTKQFITTPAWLILIITVGLLCAPLPRDLQAAYDLICIFLIFPLLILLAVHNEPKRGKLTFTALGLISYPMYAINVPVQSLVLAVLKRASAGPATFAPWLGIAVVAALVPLSWVLARYIDPPLRRSMGRLLARPRVSVGEVAFVRK